MDIVTRLQGVLDPALVLTGTDAAPWTSDWIGKYRGAPLCVVRPGSTQEVSRVMALAQESGTPVVPVGGNTGLSGGAFAEGAIALSLDRMRSIREIRAEARLAIVEAGVVLEVLHEAAAGHGLSFPMTFGAKGSCTLGGMLATNAGGSNVLRYGNTRDLCLGLEVVLPDGQVLNLMSELHKDNTGYDLKDLFIGAEGTLGVITGAVLKLSPAPRAYATAMVAAPGLSEALALLNRLQEATGGAVEAFEYMPGAYIDAHVAHTGARPPFDVRHDVNILVEAGATAPRDATPGPDGSVPVVSHLEEVLGEMLEEGTVRDAVIARNDSQRAEMWARREAAAEVCLGRHPLVNNDISVPLDRVGAFFTRMEAVLPGIDPGAGALSVAHLGDGNIHYTVYPSDAGLADAVMQAVEDVVLELGGSFSAEHGIGLSKKPSMARRKDPVALRVMRLIKSALDPKGIMNPGKVLPD
ncbi:FAD-binding oxidoreductase [Aliiroseovarius sp.]|uniref:FAD-binding oxidoreductase n=1 Tax=Aliiroseovarius sp. TaxID=1872442 RepID=UPI00260F3E04|nr:FAD-binding oxidoreductase [Aliiroseovarius sp.]